MVSNTCPGLFSICHFVHAYMHNLKTKSHYKDALPNEQLLYYRRYLFSGLELPLCVLTHITWKLQVIHGLSAYRTTVILWRHSLCGLDFHERSDWRATVPYWKPIYTSLFGAQLWMTTNSRTCTLRLRLMYLIYYIPNIIYQMTTLLPLMHLFIRTKLASYTTGCRLQSISTNHVR